MEVLRNPRLGRGGFCKAQPPYLTRLNVQRTRSGSSDRNCTGRARSGFSLEQIVSVSASSRKIPLSRSSGDSGWKSTSDTLPSAWNDTRMVPETPSAKCIRMICCSHFSSVSGSLSFSPLRWIWTSTHSPVGDSGWSFNLGAPSKDETNRMQIERARVSTGSGLSWALIEDEFARANCVFAPKGRSTIVGRPFGAKTGGLSVGIPRRCPDLFASLQERDQVREFL